MRFYLVDDDPNILKILEGVIHKEGIGAVLGSQTCPQAALEDIGSLKPDIVLVDYLMPGMDGAKLVKRVKERHPQVVCIIISQVSDKDMIGESYEAGIEFFIQKPINIIEVRRVLGSIIEKIEMKKALSQIGGLVSQTSLLSKPVQTDQSSQRKRQQENMKKVLSKMGILGEKGAHDILCSANALMEKGVEQGISDHLNDICLSMGQKPKIMRQRMRRTLQHGLRNIATMGVEDYLNDVFVSYSGSFFDFEEVKVEMDCIRGLHTNTGRVNVNKFLEALIIESQAML